MTEKSWATRSLEWAGAVSFHAVILRGTIPLTHQFVAGFVRNILSPLSEDFPITAVEPVEAGGAPA